MNTPIEIEVAKEIQYFLDHEEDTLEQFKERVNKHRKERGYPPMKNDALQMQMELKLLEFKEMKRKAKA